MLAEADIKARPGNDHLTRPVQPRGIFEEQVTEITHWTNKLFSFKTTRNRALRFESGQFVMIGLQVGGRPLMRAYSIASAVYDDFLEFFSIKVPDGPLTSRLQHISVGDKLLVSSKPTGTLLIGNLKPGKRLYLLGTGTGFAPFSSIIRDPETYDRFETIIVANCCRTIDELAFGTQSVIAVRQSEFLGETARSSLLYYTAVTREPYYHHGRLTTLMDSGQLPKDLGLPPLDKSNDRVMICGNPAMLTELKTMLLARQFADGSGGDAGEFVIEKAFAER